MIRIAVVDDEKAICDELLFFLKEYEMKFKMIFDISIYYNGEIFWLIWKMIYILI